MKIQARSTAITEHIALIISEYCKTQSSFLKSLFIPTFTKVLYNVTGGVNGKHLKSE